MTPQDVALGRLAQARRLVAPDALRAVAHALPPGMTLAAALVQRGLLAPSVAEALLLELSASETSTLAGSGARQLADPVAEAPTVAGGGPRPVGARGLPEPGDVIAGRFELRSVLGKGGMGAVFRARDRTTGEDVALKVILAEAAPDARAMARFQREAEAVARVDSHPGIVRIRAAGLHEGRQPWAAMDLIVGRDLKGMVKELGPRPLEVALDLVEKIARAVQHCHERGIVHRDLKPANILVRDDDLAPMVTDFGLALDAQAERLTRTGEILGTPAYMPPEQLGGGTLVDARSDVYALGAILFELLAARAPFLGDGLHNVLKKVLLEAPPRPTSLRPELPADVDAIVLKALAKERLSRYPTAAAFADDCARLRRGEPIEARAPSRGERLRWRLRQRDPRVLAPLAILVLALAGAVLLVLDRRPPGPTEVLRARVAVLGAALDRADPTLPDAEVAALTSDLLACLPADVPGRPHERLELLSGLAPADPDPRLAALGREMSGREALVARLALRVAVQAGGWSRCADALDPAGGELRLLRGLRGLGWGAERADPAALTSAAADLRLAAQASGAVGQAATRVIADVAAADAAAAAEAAAEADALAGRFADALRGERPQLAWSRCSTAADDPLRAYRAWSWRAAQRRALSALLDRVRPLIEGDTPVAHLTRLQEALKAIVGLIFVPGPEQRAQPAREETAAAAQLLGLVVAKLKLLRSDVDKKRLSVELLCPLLDTCIDATEGEPSDLAVETFGLLFDTIQPWVQEGAVPPSEIALAFMRLGFLPTDYAPPEVLRRAQKERRFVEWAEKHRTGDAWLLAAEAVSELELDEDFGGDLSFTGTASEQERKRQGLELALQHRARAHGERLSPALRARLGLAPAAPLARPMTPRFEAVSLGLLFVGLGYLESQRASPSQDVLDACMEELEVVRAAGGFPDLTREVKFLSEGGRLALGCRALRRYGEPWRAACLERAEAWFRASVEVGARLMIRTKEGARSEREGSLVGLSKDGGDPSRDCIVGLSRPARDLASTLLEAGRPAEGRAVAERAIARLRAEGEPAAAAEVEYWAAVCALATGQVDDVPAMAERHIALGRLLHTKATRSRERRQSGELLSSGRYLLCRVALAHDDRESARAEYRALRQERPDHDPGRDPWWKGLHEQWAEAEAPGR